MEDRDLFLAECLNEGAGEPDREAGAHSGATSADVRLALIAFAPERAFLCVVRAGREALNSSQNSRRGLAGNRRVSCAINSLKLATGAGRGQGAISRDRATQHDLSCSSHTLIGLLSRLGATTLGRSAAGAVRRPCRPWQRTSRSVHSARRLPAFGRKATRGVSSDGGLSGVSVPILPRPRPAPLGSRPVAPLAWDRGELLGGCERTCSRLVRGVERACVAVGGWAPGG